MLNKIIVPLLMACVLGQFTATAGQDKSEKNAEKHREKLEREQRKREKEEEKDASKREKEIWKRRHEECKDQFPPSWAKWDDKQRKKWRKDVDVCKEEVRTVAIERKITVEERERAEIAVEIMTRKGVEAPRAREAILSAWIKGINIEVILRETK